MAAIHSYADARRLARRHLPWMVFDYIDGAAGAAHVLRCILAEADLLMAVNGYPDLAAVRAAGASRSV